MKMCVPHWDELKAAIRDRGLDRFIAKSGEEAAKRMSEEYPEPKQNFEPLMMLNNMIFMRTLDVIGLDLMLPQEDGSDKCPLCETKKDHDATCPGGDCVFTMEGWIGGAADAVKKKAIELGLVALA